MKSLFKKNLNYIISYSYSVITKCETVFCKTLKLTTGM